jgi:Tol biopolymer transport system component
MRTLFSPLRAAVALAGLAILMAAPVANGEGPQTERVSVTSDGEQGDAPDGFNSEVGIFPAISDNARFVSFDGFDAGLVPGDDNEKYDSFLHDRLTGETSQVSIRSDGGQANGQSGGTSLSSTGRYVAFVSEASNLVPGDDNGTLDVFIHDRKTGETTRVSVASNGAEANDSNAGDISISGNGRYIAFHSYATNLVPGDTNGDDDVFVHDVVTGETTRVSVDSQGRQASPGNRHVQTDEPSISADGRRVAFESSAAQLVHHDDNKTYDVFVHNLASDKTKRISVDQNGEEFEGPSYLGAGDVAISGDGRSITYRHDSGNTAYTMLRDQATRTTTIIGLGYQGRISADGNYVAFGGDSPTARLYDRLAGTTSEIDHVGPLSADGRFMAFDTWRSDIVPGDTNNDYDTFVQGPLH